MPKAGTSVLIASAGAACAFYSSMRTVTSAPTDSANFSRQAGGRSATATGSITTAFIANPSSGSACFEFIDHSAEAAILALTIARASIIAARVSAFGAVSRNGSCCSATTWGRKNRMAPDSGQELYDRSGPGRVWVLMIRDEVVVNRREDGDEDDGEEQDRENQACNE
jgi:hypothetical protein